jgi:Uma2 family endonuclease
MNESTIPQLSATAWPEDYQPRLFTAADLAQMPSELPSGPVYYELHHGRLITMPPPGDIHCAVELNIGSELKFQGERKGHGKARSGEVGIVLGRNPDHVVGADAVFIANRSLPLRQSTEGYLETIPELVVEVRSKNDSRAALGRKAEDYLRVGVVVVWVVDPMKREVAEYRQGGAVRIYADTDTLTVEDIIPGFACEVRVALEE